VYYPIKLSIPRNTSIYLPVRGDIHLTRGTTKYVRVIAPDGPYGLAGIMVHHRDSQICPWVRGEWICLNETVQTFPCEFPLDTPPYDLAVYGYNEDDYFQHTFEVGIDFIEGEVDTGLVDFFRQLREFAGAQQ